jgi:hypothetical protein
MQHARRLQRLLRHTWDGSFRRRGRGRGRGRGLEAFIIHACLSACLSPLLSSLSSPLPPLPLKMLLFPREQACSHRRSASNTANTGPLGHFPPSPGPGTALSRWQHVLLYFTAKPLGTSSRCSQWLLASARAAKYPTAKWHALSRTHSSAAAAAAAHTHSTRITAVQMCHTISL